MRIFCIGQNYAAHAREMGKAPAEPNEPPVVFMKPSTSLVPAGQDVPWPRHDSALHFETELVVGIGQTGHPVSELDALSFIDGFTLGFDLTLRDLQSRLKAAGQPWERAKAFDHSALCGALVRVPLQRFTFTGTVAGTLRQTGDTTEMLYSIPRLLVELGKVWQLLPGDLIFTGTPSGVGPLAPGDTLVADCPVLGRFVWRMDA
jgi:2-keto-4-pentenoate hydratase/2-oxohepta-3-ene-1,7-dioic acid hydratase in catechol pathway